MSKYWTFILGINTVQWIRLNISKCFILEKGSVRMFYPVNEIEGWQDVQGSLNWKVFDNLFVICCTQRDVKGCIQKHIISEILKIQFQKLLKILNCTPNNAFSASILK